MAWRVLVGVYVAAVVAALLIVNGDQSGAPAAAGLVAAGAIALGWGTASGWGAVVAWLLVPVALPFGETNQFTGGGGTDLVVLFAAVSAAMSTVLIFAAARARVLYDRRRPRRRASQPATNGTLPSLDPTNAIDPGLRDAAPINAPTPAARQPTAAHRR
ncbi:MAG: hypothetical protein AABM66_10370 [Actinomycetota bacterium]